MRLIRKVLLGGAALASATLVLTAVLVVRTLTLVPSVPAPQPIALAGPIPIDIDHAARHLSEAVRFQTISHQDHSQDNEQAWDDQRAWLVASYPRFHAVAQREIVGDGVLLYTWNGSDPSLQPIILMAHQDVVPVTEGTEHLWKAPPFSGQILDGAIWGRGTIDNKGSMVAIMEAAETLAAHGFAPSRTIILLYGNHEETSGGQIGKAVQLLAARGTRALFVLDEGLVIVELSPGIPKPTALVGVAEKGYATMRVTARGEGGHSSRPPANTAVVTLAKALVAIDGKPFPMAIKGPTEQMLQGLAADQPFAARMAMANSWLFGSAITAKMAETKGGDSQLRTTMAPTMLEGSPKENVLPPTATARINFRIYPGETMASVMAHTRKSIGDLPVELDWEGKPGDPSVVSATNTVGYRTIASLASDMEQVRTVPALSVGATDSRFLAPIASDIYKFQFIRLDATAGTLVHGTNEHMTIENLSRLTQFFGRLMKTTAG
jgi:carboxypeptidase PM20D1